MGRTTWLLAITWCLGCVPPRVAAVIAAPDRPATDKELDAERRPAELLTFTLVAEGQQVGELVAGSGYTTELLSRAVGPLGVVYGQNPRRALTRVSESALQERVQRLFNVVRLDRALDDPFPMHLSNTLDLVLSNATYHDAAWLGAGRARLNHAVFRALKPGGRYVVCDSTAGEGRGDLDALTAHRIEERTVREEVLRAGFRFDAGAGYLRNPSERRDWNGSPIGKAEKPDERDRFCLRFVRPREQ